MDRRIMGLTQGLAWFNYNVHFDKRLAEKIPHPTSPLSDGSPRPLVSRIDTLGARQVPPPPFSDFRQRACSRRYKPPACGMKGTLGTASKSDGESNAHRLKSYTRTPLPNWHAIGLDLLAKRKIPVFVLASRTGRYTPNLVGPCRETASRISEDLPRKNSVMRVVSEECSIITTDTPFVLHFAGACGIAHSVPLFTRHLPHHLEASTLVFPWLLKRLPAFVSSIQSDSQVLPPLQSYPSLKLPQSQTTVPVPQPSQAQLPSRFKNCKTRKKRKQFLDSTAGSLIKSLFCYIPIFPTKNHWFLFMVSVLRLIYM
ncbi:hypothetical protein B0H17DRAFT_1185989 [Mycena rosella]|uniref:Uncharacterized protein n=1 Tax=Mycena rosella TaxID=1033263 RepID=A0AAD7CRH9_MYCRO|nr:hypothetical protein B0H17DRAFT_1185989 [Mycena rosella]